MSGNRIREELEALRARADEAYATSNIEGIGETLRDLLDLLARIADGNIGLKAKLEQITCPHGHIDWDQCQECNPRR